MDESDPLPGSGLALAYKAEDVGQDSQRDDLSPGITTIDRGWT